MVAINLLQLVLSDAADPSVAVSVKMLAGSSKSWPANVEDRPYAGGRIRLAGGPRLGRVWTPLLGMMPRASAVWLHERAGLVHWARDPLGGKVACYWQDAAFTELGPIMPDGGLAAAVPTFVLREVTHAEVTTAVAASATVGAGLAGGS